ncbi:MAG: hypothetical protein Q9185_006155 [Variospora sp. 1 TL-2023]
MSVLEWYHARELPVQPVTPSRSSINVASTTYPTVSSVKELSSAPDTSLSIVTQPHITIKLLHEAKEAGISCVWMQPGSFDDESLQYAKKEFKAAVGGFEDNPGNGREGWCVLVDGDDAIFRAKEDKAGGKL